MAVKRYLGGVIFMLLVAAFVGVFDGIAVSRMLAQIRAGGRPTVPAVVLTSDVDSHRGSNSMIHRPTITFEYVVAGTTYVGEDYRYGPPQTNDRSIALEVVGRYPVGAAATAYYDPNDPSDAVIEVGLDGHDYFWMVFLLPFNLITIGGWALLLSMMRHRPDPSPGRFATRQSPRGIRVRLTRLGPLSVALLVGLVASFLSIFVVGFSAGMAPPVRVAVGALVVVGALMVVGFFWRGRQLWRGDRDLIVDMARRVLDIPRAPGRGERRDVSFDDVLAVQFVRTKGSSGNSTEYDVRLVTEQRMEWLTSCGEEDASGLAAWLRDTIGLESAETHELV